MKILFVSSKFPRYKDDPQPAFTYYLARALIALGHEIHVVCPHHKGASYAEVIDGIHAYRFPYFWPVSLQRFAYGAGIPANVRESHLAKIQAPSFVLSEIAKTREVTKEISPDVVHAHWAFPQGLAARTTGLPYVVTVYGGEVFLSKQFRLIRTLDSIIRKSHKSYALTTGLRQIMREFGVTAPVGVIPLGVDTEIFRPKTSGSDAIKKKFCPGGEKMVLCVGRLVEKKGIEYLIQAFRRVKDSFKKTKLVIVGDGPLYEELLGLTTKLRLHQDITFTKEVSHKNLPKYYSAADLFVLPSIIDSKGDRETQGVVYLEAMASKTAVIGTNTGGIPDVISSKEVGVMVKQKDPDALSKEMMRLLKDDSLRKRIGEAGYKHVHKHFTWAAIAKRYAKSYETAMKTPASHARLDKASRVNKAKKIVAVTEKFVKLKRCTVLDIGTGSGHIASELGKRCKRMVSVDVSDERKEKRGYKYVKFKGGKLPFDDATFDVAVSNHVIEHVPNQQQHLDEIRRVLKPKGIAYVAFPNKYAVVEPHYKLPFLSWLPRSVAKLIVKGWDVYPMSYRRFAILAREGFCLYDMSERVLREPEKYKLDVHRFVHPFIRRLPRFVMGAAMVFVPTRITVLEKR